jgi:hypothetical protein
VVEWDGLENRCAGNRTVGSNPTLSARNSHAPWGAALSVVMGGYFRVSGNLSSIPRKPAWVSFRERKFPTTVAEERHVQPAKIFRAAENGDLRKERAV